MNLPIGTYTLTYTADGYEVQKTQHITVQANDRHRKRVAEGRQDHDDR